MSDTPIHLVDLLAAIEVARAYLDGVSDQEALERADVAVSTHGSMMAREEILALGKSLSGMCMQTRGDFKDIPRFGSRIADDVKGTL
jgi:hypothetical protein